MRPPDHNIFVNSPERCGSNVAAKVTHVGKRLEHLFSVGNTVVVQKGKFTAISYQGVDYVSVPEHFILCIKEQ